MNSLIFTGLTTFVISNSLISILYTHESDILSVSHDLDVFDAEIVSRSEDGGGESSAMAASETLSASRTMWQKQTFTENAPKQVDQEVSLVSAVHLAISFVLFYGSFILLFPYIFLGSAMSPAGQIMFSISIIGFYTYGLVYT